MLVDYCSFLLSLTKASDLTMGSSRGLLGEVRFVSRHVAIPASNQEIANARKT